jgi:uncharacterized protein (TIGR02001 family)
MSLKNKFKLSSIALASAMAMGAMTMPTVASADVESSATLSSMYLWRGQDVSTGKPALSGDIKYSHSSGAYAFGWLSSEGSNSYEIDLGLGYAGKIGSVGYDISYYKYWYPTTNSGTFGDAGAEVVLAMTFSPVTVKAYIDATAPATYTYLTVGGSAGNFDLMVGLQNDKDSAKSYSHLDITYNATNSLSFTLSNPLSRGSNSIKKDPIMMMSYSLPIDIK